MRRPGPRLPVSLKYDEVPCFLSYQMATVVHILKWKKKKDMEIL